MDGPTSTEVATVPRRRLSFTLGSLLKVVFFSAVVCAIARFEDYGLGYATICVGVLLGRWIVRRKRTLVTWAVGLLGGTISLAAAFAAEIAYQCLSFGGLESLDFVEISGGFRSYLVPIAVFASAAELLAKALIVAQHVWKRLVHPPLSV